MSDLKELLNESGCSPEFIQDAIRYEKLFTGNIDIFIDKVEEILLNDALYGDEFNTNDDDDFDDDEEVDPIYQSDYNYDGNDANVYFEEEVEEFEDDEEED